jgi:hypothetical protein
MQQTGLLRHVAEGAVAVITVKDVLTPVRNEQVVESIVVVVAHRYSGCPTRAPQSRLLGNVRKRTVPIILVQTIRGAGEPSIVVPLSRKMSSQPSLS